jgi:fumarate hydratase class II
VGNGLNTHPDFAKRVIAGISEETDCPFKEADNHFEAQAAQDAAVETSGALKTVAASLVKIANDIRWLGSGPRCGLGEIQLPSLQPGSSIMPGKVNPVIPEVVVQVAGQVFGNDVAITYGGQAGNFELNVMLPLIARNLLESIELLGNAATALAEKCVLGILANREKCTSNLEQSLALATPFVPHIGYDESAALAKKAFETGKTVREVASESGVLPEDEVNKILDEIVGGND